MRECLKSWFPFRGRVGRRQYWISTLLYLLFWVLGVAILITLAALNYNTGDTITNTTIVSFVLLSVAMIVFVFVIVIGLASTAVRRLHDRGKTGVWLLLYYALPMVISRQAGFDTIGLVFWLVTLGIFIWAIVDLGILRGEAGSNAFGPNLLPENPGPSPAN